MQMWSPETRACQKLESRLKSERSPVGDGGCAIIIWKEQLPHPEIVLGGPVTVLGLPVVELSHERQRLVIDAHAAVRTRAKKSWGLCSFQT